LRDCVTRNSTKLTWTKVRHILRCSNSNSNAAVVGINAQTLNDHYADISTDHNYTEPTAHDSSCLISELEVFRKLHSLRPTATGLDTIPAWFLRVGEPAFAVPLARLLNQSMSAGVVPKQWKVAAKPAQCTEFRPISVTPVLSRLIERYIVQTFIYPALQHPPHSLADQYAFRPTGSTTAALIALFHTVRDMLSANNFVYIIAFGFFKSI